MNSLEALIAKFKAEVLAEQDKGNAPVVKTPENITRNSNHILTDKKINSSISEARLSSLYLDYGIEGRSTLGYVELGYHNLHLLAPDRIWTVKVGGKTAENCSIKLTSAEERIAKDIPKKIYSPQKPLKFHYHFRIPEKSSHINFGEPVSVSLFIDGKETAPSDVKFSYVSKDINEDSPSKYNKTLEPLSAIQDSAINAFNSSNKDFLYLSTLNTKFGKEVVYCWLRRCKDGLVGTENIEEGFKKFFAYKARLFKGYRQLDLFGRNPAFELACDIKCPPTLLRFLFTECEYDINATDYFGCTCYHWAKVVGNVDAANLIDQQVNEIDKKREKLYGKTEKDIHKKLVNHFGFTADEFRKFFIDNLVLNPIKISLNKARINNHHSDLQINTL